jgi:hypothetical protein
MAQYNFDQLKSLWTQYGGNAQYANIAAAVALAESGGRSTASNNNTDGSQDRGLWQINTVHGGLSTFDVAANTKAAIQISNGGTNWNPWVTFKTGAYKKFLTGGGSSVPDATTAGINIPGVGGISVSGVVSGAVNTLLKMMGLSDLRDMLERAGLIILGFALVIMGIHILSSGSSGGSLTNVNVSESGKRSSSKSKSAVSDTTKTTAKKSLAGEAVEAAAVA